MPMGTSIRPLLAILPVSAKTQVPLLFSVPVPAYQSTPREIIAGTVARDFTLLMVVGLPHKPELAGKGGRERGMQRLPSIEASSAVSSPQTKAPAPSLTCIFRLKSEPSIFFPR